MTDQAIAFVPHETCVDVKISKKGKKPYNDHKVIQDTLKKSQAASPSRDWSKEVDMDDDKHRKITRLVFEGFNSTISTKDKFGVVDIGVSSTLGQKNRVEDLSEITNQVFFGKPKIANEWI